MKKILILIAFSLSTMLFAGNLNFQTKSLYSESNGLSEMYIHSNGLLEDGCTIAFRIENRSSDKIRVKFGEGGENDGNFDYNYSVTDIPLEPGESYDTFDSRQHICLVWNGSGLDDECSPEIKIEGDGDGYNTFAKIRAVNAVPGQDSVRDEDGNDMSIKLYNLDSHLIMDHHTVDVSFSKDGYINFTVYDK